MDKLNDDWIKDRILWNLRKNGMPQGCCSYYGQFDLGNVIDLRVVAESGTAGIPVAVFCVDSERWTLVGTRAIVTKVAGKISQVGIEEIADSAIEGADDHLHADCEWLEILDKAGNLIHIWGPAGMEFLSLASLVAMFVRFNKSATTVETGQSLN